MTEQCAGVPNKVIVSVYGPLNVLCNLCFLMPEHLKQRNRLCLPCVYRAFAGITQNYYSFRKYAYGQTFAPGISNTY